MSEHRPTPEFLAFRRALATWLDVYDQPDSIERDHLADRLIGAAHQAAQPVLTRTPSSWADVVEIAEVARGLFDDDGRHRDHRGEPRNLAPPDEATDQEDVLLALMSAVLTMGGANV
jgi:hypothetical protein